VTPPHRVGYGEKMRQLTNSLFRLSVAVYVVTKHTLVLYSVRRSVVVKDLRFEDEDKDKDLWSKDKDL